MAIEKIDIDTFIELSQHHAVLDVRSPGEYKHAHIPGACNLPLFSDEERKVVGTAYKQQGREAAIKIGLDYFGVKMRGMVEAAEKITFARLPSAADNPRGQDLHFNARTVLTHCWRGGMRSAAVAWLLDLYGFKVYTLNGGYKAFRHHVLETFKLPFRFNMMAGYTGSGKTSILYELARQGEAIIDLEALAQHRGSAFGGIGQPPQPSQEMFENRLALELRIYSPSGNCIWLEDESQRIGTVTIPPDIWEKMRRSNIYFLIIPAEARLNYISGEYGYLDKDKLGDAIRRIQKRLGGMEAKTAIEYLAGNNIKECFRVLLTYYDKYYGRSLLSRQKMNECLVHIEGQRIDGKENAQRLIAAWQNRKREEESKSSIHAY
ncbi:MAG: tRNA 2-selenouridine(34) synthase MnmH [Chitinophagaceae bacterium]